MSESIGFLNQLFKKMEDIISNHNNTSGAHLVLFVLGTSSYCIGWENMEEVHCFNQKWLEVQEKLNKIADKEQFKLLADMIGENIKQVLDKSLRPDERKKSSLLLHKDYLLFYLENTFRP